MPKRLFTLREAGKKIRPGDKPGLILYTALSDSVSVCLAPPSIDSVPPNPFAAMVSGDLGRSG